MKAMWVMIAGPYGSGARSDEERAANLKRLNAVACEVLSRGHIPIIGVNLALPIIEAAGADSYDRIMMPMALAVAERCDAVLRVGGPSQGADQEVERIRNRGGLLYTSATDLPRVT